MFFNNASEFTPYVCPGDVIINQNSNFYDYQIGASCDMSSGMSSSSNPDSPESSYSQSPSHATSVTLSPTSMQHFLGMSTEEQAANNIGILTPSPYLIVREQPIDKYRFRYKSEMMGSHGCMVGRRCDKRKKTFPAVELMGYDGPAIIRCSVYTNQKDETARTFHCHRLIIRVDKEDVDDPHQIPVNKDSGYIAVFQGMGIIHTAKKNIAPELARKMRLRLLEQKNSKNINLESLTQNEEATIRADAEREARIMDLNVVTLGFEAFVPGANGVLVPLCDPVFSEPVFNMKSALTGELKICRIDRHFSTCVGGDEVWMLVEKVGRKNIKVKFYEMDDDDNEIWCDYGKFSELDVHHQYAIVFRTPPYRFLDIDEQKDVLIQLTRPSDGSCSEPIKFIYTPSDKFGQGEISRKRPRASSNLPLPTNVVNPVMNGFALPNTTSEFLDTTANPMFPASGLDSDLLGDIDHFSVSSLTLEQALNEDNLTSTEFNNFLRDDSFQDYLKTYEVDMDLATDGGAPKRPSTTTTYQPRLPKAYKSAVAVDINASRSTAPTTASELESSTKTSEVNGDDLLKLMMVRLLEMMAMKPLPSATAVSIKLQDLFETRTEGGDSALHFAVKPENKVYFHKIRIIILKSRTINSENLQLYISDCLNARNKKLETPLNRAVCYDQPATVEALLRIGACPNLPDATGFTPLHIAVNSNHNDCLRVLLDPLNYKHSSKKLQFNVKSEDGFSPLHLAARKKNLEAVKLLVAAGADVNEKDQTNGRTPLHLAIEEECVEIVRFLVAQPQIRINEQNLAGNTALHMACVADVVGSLELCKILVEANANPRIRNFDVEVASEDDTESQQDDANVVMKKEPDESWEPHGQTSLDLASENREILELLQESESNPTAIQIKEEPKEEPTTNIEELFDFETFAVLCSILDTSGGWMKLAQLLDYSFLIAGIANSISPSRALFNYAEIHSTTTVDQIRDVLSLLDETDAVKVIDEMLARRIAVNLS